MVRQSLFFSVFASGLHAVMDGTLRGPFGGSGEGIPKHV